MEYCMSFRGVKLQTLAVAGLTSLRPAVTTIRVIHMDDSVAAQNRIVLAMYSSLGFQGLEYAGATQDMLTRISA